MSAIEYSITDATLEDAMLMAHDVREVDVQEIWAANRSKPLEALVGCVRNSEHSRTGRANGEIVCMFGTMRSNLMGTKGIIWMLGTDLLKKYAVRFLRENKNEIVKISSEFSIVENYCDTRNTATLRWLKWLGFTIEEAEPYGVYNLLFHHFYKEVS